MTTKVYAVKCKTEKCDGHIPLGGPKNDIFKPNVVVTGKCSKCGAKHIYEKSDVIQLGEIRITESSN